MKLRTELKIKKADFDISHQDKLMFIGSCFSNNIGTRFSDLKFKTLINPNGIIFNPLSICNTLNNVIDNKRISEENIIKDNELFHSFLHHGSFSNISKEELKNSVDLSTNSAHNFLKELNVMYVTFGSAFAYFYKGNVVANCHKIPQCNFEKRLLSIDEIISCFKSLLEKLRLFNPQLKIVFTVSPVRHIKDGIVENNLSKSTLLLAINSIIKEHLNCSYFPSFELILDDLRDYRFFEEDLVHPNNVAVNYIWKKLESTYFSESTLNLCKEVNNLTLAKNHKLLHPNTEQSKKFVSNTQFKLQEFKNKTGIEI